MKQVPTFRLILWLTHPDTHPVVVEMCGAELKRRGIEVGA